MPELNEGHERRIRVWCRDVDERLGRLQEALSASDGPVAAIDDLTREQKHVACGDIVRMRQRLAALQENIHVRSVPPRVTLSWQISAALRYCQDAIAQMTPSRLRGYGQLDGETADRLQEGVNDIDLMMTRLGAYLDQCSRHPD